jgi:hypothetical protein
MLDRRASINQQQMAMCNVQTSQLLSTLCFVILSKESTILYILKNKNREVPQIPIQKTQRKLSIIFIFM